MAEIRSRLIDHFRKKKLYYLYTIAFCILYYYTVIYWGQKYGKTLIWRGDGVDAEYIPFVYVGKWIREIFDNLIHFRHPVIPMWDMSIGYGSDIITTFQGTLYDPFNWIAAFFPMAKSELAFRIAIVLKRYFAGLTFLWFVKYKKVDDASALAGAISYVFCVAMLICIKQVYLIDPFYVFPLVLLGVEKLWESKKGIPFYSSMLALAIINSYYYTYMMGIFVAFILVAKLIMWKEKNLKDFGFLAARFFGGTVLGGVTGVGLLLGGIVQLMGTSRVGYSLKIWPLYEEWRHQAMVQHIIGGAVDTGNDVIFGISIITFICVVLLFFKKGYRAEKIGFVALTVCFFIPFVGHVFNGFNYPTNRWVFGYALLLSWIVSLTFKQLCNISVKESIAVLVVFVVHYIICLKLYGEQPGWYWPVLIFGLVSVCILLVYSLYQGGVVGRPAYMMGYVLLSVSCFISSYLYLDPSYGGFINDAANKGAVYDDVIYMDGKTAVINDDICETGRYDQFIARIRNSSMLIGAKGIDFYLHFYNENIDRYHKELGVPQDPDSFSYTGLYERNLLEFVNGVNAIVSIADDPYITEGYDSLYKEFVVKEVSHLVVYTGPYPRTMAMSYDKAVPYEDYEGLSEYDRESLFVKACVVDGESANADLNDISLGDGKVQAEMQFSENTSYDGGVVSTNGETGNIGFDFDEINESGNLFLRVHKIKCLTDDRRWNFHVEGRAGHDDDLKFSDTQYISTADSPLYGQKESLMLNLGHIEAEDKVNNVQMFLPVPGDYSVEDIEVCFRPDSEIREVSDSMSGKYCNMSMTDNGFNVDISGVDDRYVYISVPYSSGWSAEIDGRPVDILRADTAFMAVDTSAIGDTGSGILEFRYKSPMFGLGFFITLAGFAVIFVIWMMTEGRFFCHLFKGER